MTDATAVVGADAALDRRLRTAFGLAAGSLATMSRDVAYCGREFRVYRSMRVGRAVAFYAALHDRWNGVRLREDLELARLDPSLEVGRMKRAYQRALVLALACASEPTTLVVEAGEEFDEPGTGELLDRCVERTARSIVAYGSPAPDRTAPYDRIVNAIDFSPLAPALR